jgi:hypothetical protein
MNASLVAFRADEEREHQVLDDIDDVAIAIVDYLGAHPHASDTIIGIARWWLAPAPVPISLERLEKALRLLVTSGQVVSEILGDGQRLFRRGPALRANNEEDLEA